MAAIDINRTTTISLPGAVSRDILQKTQEASAVMALAKHIALPGLGVTIPVITGDPEAGWVGETEKKPVKRGTLATKVMNMILLAIVMAVTVEGLIEYAKTIGKAVQGGQVKTAATQAVAIVLGVLLCLAVGADVYGALGVTFALPWVGTVLTGIFASRGSNYISDLAKRLQTVLSGSAVSIMPDGIRTEVK